MFVDWLDAMRKGRAACVSGAEAIRYVELIESVVPDALALEFPVGDSQRRFAAAFAAVRG